MPIGMLQPQHEPNAEGGGGGRLKVLIYADAILEWSLRVKM